ncbi:putative nuclear distribution protein nudF-like [Homarus americanus]|uniref:Putative nuclear distribution protein nudF-like n=1 Tax=Homarus americanus TaxID=6706 RepID=A0A8J5MNF9_HOMAM|nr:putative nuclear distribution protein nudF-like [Homarus americanus]
MEEEQQLSPADKAIRKIRKKLRQIEHLELMDRELNEEEFVKVSRKIGLRKDLRKLLKEHHPHETDVMKRQGANLNTEEINVKKFKNIDTSNINQEIPDEPEGQEGALSSDTSRINKQQQEISTRLSANSQNPSDVATASMPTSDFSPVNSPPGYNNTSVAVRPSTPSGAQRNHAVNQKLAQGQAKPQTSVKREKSLWLDNCYEVYTLQGHNDIILGVDCMDNYVLSARSVNVAVVGWEGLGSIYTYNGITCLSCGTWGVVTGTEGGKLEVWSVATGQRLAFVNAFQSQITALYIEKNEVYAGSADGEMGIWKYDSTRRALGAVYIMETDSVTYVTLKRLATLVAKNGKCYLGDSGPNIKILEWKKSRVSRLVNHLGDIGMTDSLAVSADGCLLAASYFVDSGCSSINVREVASDKYICSLIDKDEGRYLAMSTSPGVIVTGGHLLKVWVQQNGNAVTNKVKKIASEVIRPNILRKMSSPAVDSGSEDDTDWASSSDEDDIHLLTANRRNSESEGNSESSGWWCNIL